MNFKASSSQKNPLYERIKRFHFYGLLFILLVIPAPSFATYFAGPAEVLSALQFNAKGEVVFESEVFSQDHLIPIDPTSGKLTPSEPHVFNEKNHYGEPKPIVLEEESLLGEVETDDAEVDPYSDAAIDEEDPFGDDLENNSDLEEDPFAEEEQEVATISDPFERWYNRPVYVFNDHFYEYFMRPVAQTYKDVVAEGFRIMIRNLYQTVSFPGRFVSSLLQWKFDKAGRVISRVLINCTLGFLCTVDVANEGFGIKPVDEDFGQVLGFYGIPSGPYLVLPLLGPSSVRDGVGRAVDAVMNPLFWLVPNFATGAGVTAEQMVNETSFFIEDIKALKESAVDPYISLRDFYNQRREILIDE